MSDPRIEDEVREVLRALVDESGALSARIIEHDDSRSGIPARTLALGGGEYLRVELPSRTPKSDGGEDATTSRAAHDVEALLDRVTRQLRAIRRRWDAMRLPEVVVSAGTASIPPPDRVTARIEHFLKALASIDRATNALCTRNDKVLAFAQEPDALAATRWPFLSRRALAAHAPNSSHGEIIDPDAYAMSFWYGAVLIVLLDEPYAVDFVRHRTRAVARELANLLPMLEPDPAAPAAMRRRPPTIP